MPGQPTGFKNKGPRKIDTDKLLPGNKKTGRGEIYGNAKGILDMVCSDIKSIEEPGKLSLKQKLNEELIKSIKVICERFCAKTRRNFRGNNRIYFKKLHQNSGAKDPQSATGAFNQYFPKK